MNAIDAQTLRVIYFTAWEYIAEPSQNMLHALKECALFHAQKVARGRLKSE
jgi:hypothetical protein